MSTRRDALDGAKTVSPMAVAVGILGVVWGAGAAEQGFTFLEGMIFSAVGFSGAMQFATLGILESGGGRLSVVLTAAALATRHLLMSASLAPYMLQHSRRARAFISFFLLDESYGLAIMRYLSGRGSAAFFLAAGIVLWACWVIGTAVGLLAGDQAGGDLKLEVLFPLLFMAILLPLLRGKSELVAALSAGVAALVGVQLLPGSWYIAIAGLIGSVIGFLFGELTAEPVEAAK